MGDALLILGNLPADRPIESGGHLLALFGVVHNINAVDLQRITVGALELVMLLQHLHKVLKHLQSGGKVPGNEKEMSPAYFDGLHGVHIVLQQGFNLPPAGAVLVEFKKPLRLHTVRKRVDERIGDKIIIGKQLAGLIEGDVGQLAVFIGVLMHGLLDQLTGDHRGVSPLVIPAVHLEDLWAAVGFHYPAFINIAGGGTKSVPHGGPIAPALGKSYGVTQAFQLVPVDQDAGK